MVFGSPGALGTCRDVGLLLLESLEEFRPALRGSVLQEGPEQDSAEFGVLGEDGDLQIMDIRDNHSVAFPFGNAVKRVVHSSSINHSKVLVDDQMLEP